MKSILQHIALVSAILLVASCDSGGTSGITNIGVTPPSPQNGVSGSAVKGIISGGTITVTDSAGATVPLVSSTTTAADGAYSLVFTEAAIAAGISAPLTVTIDGTGASMICDIDNDGTDDDCAIGDGTFAAFGASYPLPAGFTMRGLVATIPSSTTTLNPVVTVNVSPATELATTLALASAAGSALTADDVNTAGSQVLGLIQTITGVDMTGQNLNEINVPNIANTTAAAAANDRSRAVAAFAAAIIANQGAGETVSAAIARVNASLSANAQGNLSATGTALGSLTGSIRTALATVAKQVTSGNGNSAGVIAAGNNAQTIQAVYVAMGANAVSVSPLPTVGDTTPLAQTKAFVAKFNNTISTALATTGGGGVGVDGQGATELLAAELDAVSKLNSGPASSAAQALEAAISAQVAAITTDSTVAFSNMDTANPVSFSITKAGSVYSLADVSSSWTSSAGTTVVITATSGTSSGDDVFELVGVSMVTTTPAATQGGTPVTAQTFTGGTIKGEVVGTNTVTTFIGTLNGASADTSFGVNVVYTDPIGMLNGDSFVATISFASTTASPLSATFSGTVGATTQNLSITAGADTIAITATQNMSGETVVFSDGPVMMTVMTLNGAVVPDQSGNIATLTVTGTATATGSIDANGTVTYSDGSFQSLPAGIF